MDAHQLPESASSDNESSGLRHVETSAKSLEDWPIVPEELGKRSVLFQLSTIAEWFMALAPLVFIGEFIDAHSPFGSQYANCPIFRARYCNHVC